MEQEAIDRFNIDPNAIKEIQNKEKELMDCELAIERIKGELRYLKSKLNIAWQDYVNYCLSLGEGAYICKTPLEISDCIASSFGIYANREMKNNVSTTLSVMFNNGKLGRITINSKAYYGDKKYFEEDRITLKNEYKYFVNEKTGMTMFE